MKSIIELIRLESKRIYGTFGVLKINKQVFCVTLEPPEWENEPDISCIPAGQYDCMRSESQNCGETFSVVGVPGRSNIIFHSGNTIEDTKGCIILAEHFGKLRGDRAVLNSGKTFKAFMGMLKDAGACHLTITRAY